jgi:hypothetical protein
VAPDRKKPRAARVAAKGGKPEKSPQPGEHPVFDALACNSLKVEVTAARAVGVAKKHERDPARIEALIASAAAPGKNACGPEYEVGETTPVRTKAIRAPALRANHSAVHLAVPLGRRILEM